MESEVLVYVLRATLSDVGKAERKVNITLIR